MTESDGQIGAARATPRRPFLWTGILRTLPPGGRLLVTAFLVIVGMGYLVAVANILYRHEMADGVPGLSMNDIRAVYGGLDVERSDSTEVPSRMLSMIRKSMRQYIESDAEFTVLETWLKKGGQENGLDVGEARQTPRRVIIRNCLRCHAQSTKTDISAKAPFGKDEFDVNYSMISRYVTPRASKSPGMIHAPPQYDPARLTLIAHEHMLTIPVFTLIVGLLFLTARIPLRFRNALVAVPMLAVLFDFAAWWLTRWRGEFVYVIATTGGIFGVALGLQIVVVLVELWRPVSSQPTDGEIHARG